MKDIVNIDIHAHFYPTAYLKLIESEGSKFGMNCSFEDPQLPVLQEKSYQTFILEQRYYDLETRVASMNEQGVDIHALSLTQPMVNWASGDLSRRLSEAFNDACVEAHQAYPERFVGLAILPMNDSSLAVAELDRVSKLPGIQGVYMATRILDKELSDPDFFPVYERIEALGWTIFLHPIKVVEPQRLKKYYLTNFIGNPTETAIAASHLIFGEVLDRFPKLTFCLPHAGGTFPYLYGRITHGWGVRPECQHLKTSPKDYLRRFYYDTITHSEKALTYLINLVGADRVVLGSDFCFDMSYQRPVEVVTKHSGLSLEDQALILGGNAQRLLGQS